QHSALERIGGTTERLLSSSRKTVPGEGGKCRHAAFANLRRLTGISHHCCGGGKTRCGICLALWGMSLQFPPRDRPKGGEGRDVPWKTPLRLRLVSMKNRVAHWSSAH